MNPKQKTRPKGLTEFEYQFEKLKFYGQVPHDAVIKENRSQRRKKLREIFKNRNKKGLLKQLIKNQR